MLHEYGIKSRPDKPASPHLNGKVERSQKTDKIGFYATIDLTCINLDTLLAERRHYNNWERSHSSLHGKTPMERYFELADKTPFLMKYSIHAILSKKGFQSKIMPWILLLEN